jgi:hypothetical protein
MDVISFPRASCTGYLHVKIAVQNGTETSPNIVSTASSSPATPSSPSFTKCSSYLHYTRANVSMLNLLQSLLPAPPCCNSIRMCRHIQPTNSSLQRNSVPFTSLTSITTGVISETFRFCMICPRPFHRIAPEHCCWNCLGATAENEPSEKRTANLFTSQVLINRIKSSTRRGFQAFEIFIFVPL